MRITMNAIKSIRVERLHLIGSQALSSCRAKACERTRRRTDASSALRLRNAATPKSAKMVGTWSRAARVNLQLAATRKDDDDIEFKNFSDLNAGAEKTMLSKYLELPLGTQVSALGGLVVGIFVLQTVGIRFLVGVEGAVVSSVVAAEELIITLILVSLKYLAAAGAAALLVANIYWLLTKDPDRK
mmetsp:Transcript_38927/g.74568  ORF Transcript_38927/g.74568 Transcript_38927/m.74568 type:complete len:186 (+) Transcript_38927:271-828(+)